MLEECWQNRRIELKSMQQHKCKNKRKSAVGITSGIQIWDWNQMLRSHNNLHLKWHTRSNMSVQRRNGQQTWIVTWLCPKFYTRSICLCFTYGQVRVIGAAAVAFGDFEFFCPS